jgi:uncharacterized membrane protein
MYQRLKKFSKLNETIFLGFLSILCFTLSIFRLIYTGKESFLFLNWNLFLAFIPWLFSSVLIIYPNLQKSRIILSTLIFSWLLFFPNAPYILTDLFHLQFDSSAPIWFDLVLILSFAWTGLMFGFISLWDLENIFRQKIKAKFIPFISSALLFLGSFGIYVGRYLRWNSWDIIREPFELFYDLSDRLISPFEYPRTWGMTFFMFIFLSIIYWSLKLIKKKN